MSVARRRRLPLSGELGVTPSVPRDGVTAPADSPPDQSLTPPIGTPVRVGRYQVKRLITDPGSGYVVYEGVAPDGTPVAIKAIRLGQEGRADLRARLRHEGIILGALGGRRHIVHCVEMVENPPALVLELVPGGSLRHRLFAGGDATPRPLRLAEALVIFAQVAEALSHAHAHDVVHRDLKPSNILFDENGLARLIDFGIARGGSDDEWDAEWLHARGGTLGYAPPELVADPDHAVHPTVDVFSLGIVLYEMLTGRLPYGAKGKESGAELAAIILQGDVRPLSAHRAYFAEPLDDVTVAALDGAILKAIQRDPQHRYQKVEEFARTIAAIGRSVLNPTRPPPRSRWQRARFWIGIGFATAVTLTAALLFWR